MNITSVDYLLTYRCNARCKHCSYQAGPQRQRFITREQARAWLVELQKIQPLKGVTIHGGEPFLYFDEMLSILEKARELGIQQRWVITNGYWAKDQASAKEKLQDLKEAGLNAITFSVDAFHQEHVSFDTVRKGIECAVQCDLDTVSVDSYFLYAENRDNSYNLKTKEYLSNLQMVPNLTINKFTASFEGRAAALLVEEEYTEKKMPDRSCRPPFWLGNSLADPGTIEIDCEGNVTLCPGISIGNAVERSLTEIVSSYDYRKHPIIKVIVERGPIGLFELGRSHGYEQNQNFVNECHLCYEMRKYLCVEYQQYLAPRSCYHEA